MPLQYTLAKKATIEYLTKYPGKTSADIGKALFKQKRVDGLRQNDPWTWLSNMRRQNLLRSEKAEGSSLRWFLQSDPSR